MFNTLQLKNRLAVFVLSVSGITMLIFSCFVLQSYESGLEKSAKLRLLSEYYGFKRDYEINPQTALPRSYVVNFHFDHLPEINISGQNILANVQLDNDEFEVIFTDDVIDDWEGAGPVFVVYKQTLHDQQIIYLVARYEEVLVGGKVQEWHDNQVNSILTVVFICLIFIMLALWLYTSLIGKKADELLQWSQQLSHDFNENKLPNFKFEEFNQLANCLYLALKKNANLIEKEKRFLAHASHEIRTPIAIIKANIEIFEKISLPEIAQQPLKRLERASNNMQLLIETLLWLGRKRECEPSIALINVPDFLDQLLDEHQYLIQGKQVTLINQYEGVLERAVAASPLMIVMNNLIRNAFQYTQQGWIKLEYHHESISIENHDDDLNIEPCVEGFGLGLDLTQRICHKLGWQLDLEFNKGGVKATLILPDAQAQGVMKEKAMV